VSNGRDTFRAIAFGMGRLAPLLSGRERRVDVSFTPRFDDYRGDGSVELLIRDVSIVDE
jgi:hypothetical protein